MGRIIVFIYGIIAYCFFLAAFFYVIAFVGNVLVSKTIDSGPEATFFHALITNIALLCLFGVQHSVMARQWFKKRWTRIVPLQIERSTSVIFASLVLALLFHQWEPMPGVIWKVGNPFGVYILSGLYWIGWFTVFLSTFMIDHFHLFGLRQVYQYLCRKDANIEIEFKTPMLYKFVRHPLYLGYFIAFWSTPKMTVGHLVFSIVITCYIFIAIQLEEQDLIRTYGIQYEIYKKQVPMIFPIFKKNRMNW
ncbi:MAG: isoprenylcysteine carboxylmethyltransferase family protein [Desulfobacteraceae bacterium]|nr:isoprenylcysteine carboxylmethyltransferase family protein [Desulfobacteraceae bacterium]